MDAFEAALSAATKPDQRELLGVISSVVNDQGTVLYEYASGEQSLKPNSPKLDSNNTVFMASAGKFILHLLALLCVDRQLIELDEPVYTHMPELQKLQIISRSQGRDGIHHRFKLQSPKSYITLRHLLTHSSGIGSSEDPILKEWREWQKTVPENASQTEKSELAPLLFEPGEGWSYGSSIEWTWKLISRLLNESTVEYAQKAIFSPLGMTSSTFSIDERPDIKSKLLEMVLRTPEGLKPVGQEIKDLACSVKDVMTLLADLMSPSSRILSKQSVEQVFKGQFEPQSKAFSELRKDTQNYAAPAGIPQNCTDPPVNWSLAGLVVESELPLSRMPPRTVTWNGMPNVIWAMNREKGLAMLFATQLYPVDDPRTVQLAMLFFESAWTRFG